MDVGIRDLKAHLSEYVRRARQGERITITDRGLPQAVLAPLPGRGHLDEGIEEGWIVPPKRPGLRGRRVARHRATTTTANALAHDRGE